MKVETHRAGEGRYAGMSELHVAAFMGDAEMVASLVEQGAKLEARSHYDYGAMPEAYAFLCDVEERKRLLARGVNTEVRLSNKGTALIMAAGHRDPAAALKLIESGANVRAADERGNTALHYAADVGSADLCRALIAAGAKPGATRSRFFADGASPLHLAAQLGSAEICEILLSAGAPWSSNDMNATPLHRAAAKGHLAACRMLVAYGASPNFRGTGSKQLFYTPLLTAMAGDRVDVVKYFLLECGGDTRIKTLGGTSLRQLAQQKGRTNILSLLDDLERSSQTIDEIEEAIGIVTQDAPAGCEGASPSLSL